MTSMATNREVGRRFVAEVLNGKDLDAMDALVAEDFVELDPLPGQRPGRAGLKQTLGMFFAGFPDLEWVIEEEIVADDKVVSRFTWRGTHRGAFLGIPATGRRVAVPGVVIDRFAGGRMQDSRLLMDTLGLMQQLGVIPAPGGGGD